MLYKGLKYPWNPQGFLEPPPADTEGQLKFCGRQNLYVDFLLHMGVEAHVGWWHMLVEAQMHLLQVRPMVNVSCVLNAFLLTMGY